MQGEKKDRFNEIQQELSQLSTKFSNNLLDATKAFKKLLKEPSKVSAFELAGLSLGCLYNGAVSDIQSCSRACSWAVF